VHRNSITWLPWAIQKDLIQLHDTTEGITELHLLAVIIKKLQALAGRLLRQDRDKSNQVIMNTDRMLTQLYTELQTRDLSEEDKQGINMRTSDLKLHLKDKMAQRALQEDARIDSFHNKDRGHMTKCSFTGVHDKEAHKNIDRLLVEGQEITDQSQIVGIMRDKYMQLTGQDKMVQDDAISRFLDNMDITLPTLTPDQQEQVGDKITRDKVKAALQTAKAHSAPGPSGQTLGFYKFIFQQIL
jgi:hypothetical protein